MTVERQARTAANVASLRPWLIAIETREAFRLTRRLRRMVRLDHAVADVAAPGGGPNADRVAVHRALAELPPKMRAAVVLHHMTGLSVAETAAALGTSDDTVKSQLRVGLSRLRQLLADD